MALAANHFSREQGMYYKLVSHMNGWQYIVGTDFSTRLNYTPVIVSLISKDKEFSLLENSHMPGSGQDWLLSGMGALRHLPNLWCAEHRPVWAGVSARYM